MESDVKLSRCQLLVLSAFRWNAIKQHRCNEDGYVNSPSQPATDRSPQGIQSPLFVEVTPWACPRPTLCCPALRVIAAAVLWTQVYRASTGGRAEASGVGRYEFNILVNLSITDCPVLLALGNRRRRALYCPSQRSAGYMWVFGRTLQAEMLRTLI